jgi:predicted GNAT family acetyltransferase
MIITNVGPTTPAGSSQPVSDPTRVQRSEVGLEGRLSIAPGGREVAYIEYSLSPDKKVLTINHTIVDEAAEGKGYGTKLVNEAVAYARETGKKIIPVCWFARMLMLDPKNAEKYGDVLYTPEK